MTLREAYERKIQYLYEKIENDPTVDVDRILRKIKKKIEALNTRHTVMNKVRYFGLWDSKLCRFLYNIKVEHSNQVYEEAQRKGHNIKDHCRYSAREMQ